MMKNLKCSMIVAVAIAFAAIGAVPALGTTEAISREITVYNDLVNPIVPKDAISREFSVQNQTYPCCGNLTDDGIVTVLDIPTFADVLCGIITDQIRRAAADVNCDQKVDAYDISLFVSRILSGYSCP